MISTQFKCILVITLMAYSAAAADITKYIAAEEIDWDVSPSGINKCTGAQFDSPAAFWTTDVLGSVYKKAQFIEYTDDSFTVSATEFLEAQAVATAQRTLNFNSSFFQRIHSLHHRKRYLDLLKNNTSVYSAPSSEHLLATPSPSPS